MTALLALFAAGLLLVLAGTRTARAPRGPVPDFDGYLRLWSPLHDGYDPRRNRWLLGWLRLSYTVARPLARRGVSPDVLTFASTWLAVAVFVPAQAGGRWPILAGWVLVASGLGDTLDGCVAVLTGRTSRWGYVLDSAVDRVNDVIYLAAVVSVGAPVWLAAVAGLAFFLLEYVRARAGNAGMGAIESVTLGERANRVILCSAGIHFGGVFVSRAESVATIAVAVLAALSVVGLGQLLVTVRRALA